MKSYMKYTIKTHKIDNKNIDKLEYTINIKTLKHVKHHDVLKWTITLALLSLSDCRLQDVRSLQSLDF